MWVRGLKHVTINNLDNLICVAPYVGAWIETEYSNSQSYGGSSHPMWVRGLKLMALSVNI